MSATRTPVQVIQAEIADLAKDMDRVIDNVIGAVPADGTGGDEFSHECFRDALKLARNHRYALESLSRQVGELLGGAS
jgi:hypothetical protein